jgi:thioredoxin reductase (NADPH)
MSDSVHRETHFDCDVAIIGGGPVGLFAVFECGMLGLRCHVIDSLEAIGGQLSALYPEKPIYDIPGLPRVLARDLVTRLGEQVAPFKPEFHLKQKVTGIEAVPGGWRLGSEGGLELYARAVIIAAGAGAFGPNRPPLADLAEYEGKSVFYLVKDPKGFAGKRLVIAGGGDSALDWALALSDLADKIYLVHRRDKFRGAAESIAQLEKLAGKGGPIEKVVPYQLKALKGSAGRLQSVTVRSLDGEERNLEADVLLPFFGLAGDLGPIGNWGLNYTRFQISVDPATCETSRPGIYAIGDIADYPRKLKLILCGFSEAALAAHAIRERLHPEEQLHWEYSTTKGLPEN